MNYEGAKENILQLLDSLSDNLYYHGKHHTLDVLQTTKELCDLENIDAYHTILMQTAALLHDSGFTIDNKNHEELGCGITRELLPKYGYTDGEIEMICSMIMSTKIPQSPKNIYEEIICDADLDYLGREDFPRIGKTLFDELSVFGVLNDIKEWNKIQIKFLSNHTYFTKTNIARRQPKKQEFIAELQELVNNY